MTRPRTIHRCRECGWSSARWTGRCGGCGEWNTLVEEIEAAARPHLPPGAGRYPAPGMGGLMGGSALGAAGAGPIPVTAIGTEGGIPLPTGVGELDRVLGGGLMPGSVTLLGGEPGVGKSTLLLQAMAAMARRGMRCLLVSAEESPVQVRQRAGRLDALVPGLWLVGETSTPGIDAAVREIQPDVLVVDSIQTVWDPELESGPGSVGQVRGCAHQLVMMAKAGGPAVVLVGHVTKEGSLAGPRVLEHLVDTVLSFEGERHHALRMVRAVKHRFGSTGELGLFEMTASGLEGVADAGALFLADRRGGTPGSVVFPTMEGQRPLLVEIQALVVSTQMVSPRRSASGFDAGRLALLLAVLDSRVGISLAHHEVYVSVVGGVRIGDPGADLAVCLALASATTGRPVEEGLVVLGEVGLGGEVRQVAHTPRRLAEAARLGFRRALVPGRGPVRSSVTLQPVATLAEAVRRGVGEVASADESAPGAPGGPGATDGEEASVL